MRRRKKSTCCKVVTCPPLGVVLAPQTEILIVPPIPSHMAVIWAMRPQRIAQRVWPIHRVQARIERTLLGRVITVALARRIVCLFSVHVHWGSDFANDGRVPTGFQSVRAKLDTV